LSEQTTPRDDAGRFAGADPFTQSVSTEVSDAMSRAVDKGDRPADAFQPMKMATPEAPKETSFDDSVQGLRSAAEELQERRQQNRAAPTPRVYQDVKTREPRPPTETRKLSEAATDLKDLRNAEADAAIAHSNQDLAQRIDQFRAERDAQEVLGEHYARKEAEAAAQQAPTPQPEAVPEATPVSSLAEKYQRLDPELKGAIEQQAMAFEGARQQSEAARAQYVGAVQQLGNAAWANIMAAFPEMTQGNPQQVLEQMRMQNPQRFAEISGHLQKVNQIGQHWQQLQAQQQQQQAQQFQQYSKEADNEFEDFKSSRPPGEAKAVNDRVINFVTRELGVDENTLRQLWNTNPIIRSPAMQRMLYMACAHSIAKESASQRAAAPVPKVVRPGESYDRPSGESVVVAAKMREFLDDPSNVRKAGAVLAAKRRAAANR
jgi:hypothetical protein